MRRLPLRGLSKAKCYQAILLTPLFISVVVGEAYAGNLYRYKNSRGFVVLDDRLPAEYVSNGYEVLSKSGRLIKVVPAHIDKPLVDTKQQELADEKRHQEDKYILASYGSREEIQNTGGRKLQLLEREIKIVEQNLADTRAQRAKDRARAANYQRSGKSVPDSIKAVLVHLEEEENKAVSLLDARRKEHADVKRLYGRYETRFAELTGEQAELSSTPREGPSEPEN